MTVDAIKEAIARLPDSERHDLVAWLNELDADEWDREMAADFSPGGRGAALIEKLKRDLGQGQSTPLEEGLREAQAEQRRPSR
ncbi:MAG: hypothetical protein J0L64_26975 [Acidobacteria bacterium]|nr:hypothetical protein [Acidobacteriota bacterium]